MEDTKALQQYLLAQADAIEKGTFRYKAQGLAEAMRPSVSGIRRLVSKLTRGDYEFDDADLEAMDAALPLVPDNLMFNYFASFMGPRSREALLQASLVGLFDPKY